MMGMESMGGMGGVAGGAATGAMFGPVGALIGAGVGAVGSAVDSSSKDKANKKQQKRAEEATQSIPGRRRASRLYDAYKDAMQQKFQSMASLSQAAMDWAQMQR